MRRFGKLFVRLTSLLVVVGLVGFVPNAYAFTSYGAGTLAKPYRIATCDQLKEMSDAPDATYVIVANIDCTGTTVAPVGNFTGSLDGRNHTVSHITLTGAGLFGLSTGATIKNLTLSTGTIATSGDSGSFVGWAINSTLDNLHSDLSVPGDNSSWVGGLVGILDGGSLANSSYSGTMSGGVDAGGLVGALNAGDPSVTNSYFTGSLTANGLNAGGIAGQVISGSLANSYSAGTIHVNGQDNVGGLVGSADSGTIADSFAANVMTGTGSSTGAVYGIADSSSSRSGAAYDQYLANDHDANSLSCAGTDQSSGSCTARNAANGTPGFFKNNTTAAPLNTWDFTDTWTKTSSYPTLQNLASFAAPGGVPNSGDANADGTADSYQANVANIKDANGSWSTVEIPGGGLCTLDDTSSTLSGAVTTDSTLTTKTSLDGFSVYCPTAGATVSVSIIYPTAFDLAGLMMRYYNPATHAWSTIPDATFSRVTIGGTPSTKVTYSLTDGGVFDQDGAEDSIIVDPVALAAPAVSTAAARTTASPTAPSTGLPAQSLAPTLASLALGSALLWIARRQTMRRTHQ